LGDIYQKKCAQRQQMAKFRPIWDRCYDFENIFAKKLAFLTQNKAKLCKNLIIAVVFENNANIFAEKCRKSPKIVIITSAPGHTDSGEGVGRLQVSAHVCHWPSAVPIGPPCLCHLPAPHWPAKLSDETRVTGWFWEKMAQNVAQTIFFRINTKQFFSVINGAQIFGLLL
jgi:hypothetical protein